jgi:hypothetical protein
MCCLFLKLRYELRFFSVFLRFNISDIGAKRLKEVVKGVSNNYFIVSEQPLCQKSVFVPGIDRYFW